MTNVPLKYLQVFLDRHGRRRVYFRRAGFERVALPTDTTSTEFVEAYRAALSSTARVVQSSQAPTTRTIHDLITLYYRSNDFQSLRDSTKRGYRNHLERFRQGHGHRSVAGVRSMHLEHIFAEMGGKSGAIRNLRKRLSRLFRFAQRLGWRDTNPVSGTEPVRSKSEGYPVWSEDEIKLFEARWPSGTRERLALALLLYTGQRRSDIVGMGWQHVSDGRISLRQIKTRERLKIAMHPSLIAEIEASCARERLTFLLTMHGKPFTANGFTPWFRQRAEMAGVRERTPHGLRKAAGRRLAEAGCSTKEIAAVLGNRTLSEIERYTRDASQALLADTAIGRLGG